MDEMERLQAQLETQARRMAELEAELDRVCDCLILCDHANQELDRAVEELDQAVDFWRDTAMANLAAAESYRTRAERAEGELAWGKVDAIMYQWNRAAVRFFLPSRCGMDD